MNRRPGKAQAQPNFSSAAEELSTLRTHLGQHLHLANNLHVKNHIHMYRKDGNRMLDPRRAAQFPLRRELTAVKKVKSLQDPSTSSYSFSPVSACNSVHGHDCRAGNGYGGTHLDELQVQERVRRPPQRSRGREGTEEFVDRNHAHRVSGNGHVHGENQRRRDTDEYAALAQRGDRHNVFPHSHANTVGYSGEERWQGDAAEIARRLIAERKGRIPSPADACMASLAQAHGLSLLGFRDDITTSEAEGSFLESEDGEAGLMASEHLSNSAGSPLVNRGHRARRRWKDTGHGTNVNGNVKVGLQNSRGRKTGNVYKEAPMVRPAVTDELDVSEIPQNGCGIPWYKPTSSANKYKSKSLLSYACAIPEAVATKKIGDSEKISRKSSRYGSQRDLQVPIDRQDNREIPSGEVELPPAREALPAASVINTRGKSRCEDDKAQVKNSSMSYKYRPKSFKDMVGQTLVVKSLTTAITKGKLAQVYLFAGPRGTGKTTFARVFAAALVCLNVEPHRRPCGLCRECATLTLNRNRDVREIDVAGSPDFDHMRSLLNLSPGSYARQQVFIIKGCESLSIDLWTSFLKFLDDPPRNVVFILITTDLERLPLSATSRCQKYHFGKLKESEIVARLHVLVEKEKLDVDEAALSLIASRAEGSLRDAESMLDQLSLLDQAITLSMVQELTGLIPDEKLVDLLDMALAADTENTVKGMRELLDAGVDALSLVAQLASLITNILAGTFDLRRDIRKKGFFHRNMSRREEQQRLRQALKVLAECEKQLRVSNDRPTWLTAALLQFAPDRSYLPSSVDTSKAPSPIAFDTFERLPPGDQPCTPRLPPPQPSARKHSQKGSSNIDVTSRFQGQKDKEKASSPVGRKAPPSGDQLQAKLMHVDNGSLRSASSVMVFDTSRVGNRDFRVLSHRDMEHIWDKVLDECRSNVLRQLLSSHGTLIALSITSDETFAVAHVEFQSSEHKARAERLRSSTCHAFQMALGCPVELKLSLESCPTSKPLQEPNGFHETHSVPSSSGVKTHTAANDFENVSSDLQLRHRHNIQPRSSRHEMLTGLAARSRRLADEGSGPRLSSHASVRDYKYCFPAAGSSRRYRIGRRPSLTRVNSLDDHGVKVRWKHPKFKGVTSIERRNRFRISAIIIPYPVLLSFLNVYQRLDP
ncbi:hypothetical protein M758_10G137200 [Ceratodon purpureus]|nr:hypothetical protein M758_10G137200 [Ceratodon purpureus]